MANAYYDSGRQAFLEGGIDWLTDSIEVVGVTSAYVFSAAHDFLSDVPAGDRVFTSGALGTKTSTGGTADAADETVSAVSGSAVAALVVFKNTGVEGTSQLICYIDTEPDGSTPISLTPNGSDVDIQWDAAGIFTL